MEMHGALPVLYVSSWLLTAFAADFPLSFAARIMDAILADSYVEPVMKARAGLRRMHPLWCSSCMPHCIKSELHADFCFELIMQVLSGLAGMSLRWFPS